jgi:hypothetical protein
MYIKGNLSDVPTTAKCIESVIALHNQKAADCNNNPTGELRGRCIDSVNASRQNQIASCRMYGNIGGGRPNNSNAFAMNTNRYSNTMPAAFIPQVQTGYAASPLLRNAGVTRLADGGSIWDSIDVTSLSSADAKNLLNVLPKANLTPKQLAILNLVTAKANQGTTTTGTTSTTPDTEVEDGTKWIYGIAFGVLGGGLLWTILKR